MMRPYTPHIGPEVAQEVMILTADIVNKHGIDSATDLMDHASAAWRSTVERIVYRNLVDNMEDAKARNHAEETDPKYAGACSQALDDVLAPLHRWTGHDWIGKVLGTVDATKDEALDHLFRAAARTVAREGLAQGLKAKETLPKFLAAEHITRKAIEEMLVSTNNATEATASTEQPYIDFMARLAEAAVPLLGTAGSAKKVEEAAAGDEDAAKHLLLFAGYAGTADEIGSTLYGAKIYLQHVSVDPAELTKTYGTPARAYSQDELHAAASQPEPASNELPETSTPAVTLAESSALSAVEALDYVRQNTGLKDTDMAECLGVSRGTIQNLISGKAKKPMTQEGRNKLADKVGEIGSRLLDAAQGLRTGQ